MAKIATVNTSDKTLILSPREGFLRQLNIGTGWIDVRIGMFFTVVPFDNDDAAVSASESVTTVDYKDWITFGLKDSSSNAPMSTGCKFIGLRGQTNASIGGSNSGGYAAFNMDSTTGIASTSGTSILGTGNTQGHTFGFPQYSATVANGYLALKFLVTNAGASNQAVTLSWFGSQSLVQQSVVTMAQLRSRLLSDSYVGAQSLVWNEASAAITLPNCFWVRLPFYNNRLRITTYGALKAS